MQIKSAVIDTIYINFNTFNISTLFHSAEIGVRLMWRKIRYLASSIPIEY